MADTLDSFMATMVASSAPLPLAQAAALAREHYGLEARAVRLSGERDENFRITAADGREFVLKIANAAEPTEVSELPVAALLHVARSDEALPCPRVIRQRSGETHFQFVDESGLRRRACLLTYLPGQPLAATQRSPQQRAACGAIAGQLSRALRDFRHPAARRPVIWDIQHVGKVVPLLDEVADYPWRPLTAGLLGEIVPRVTARLPRLRRQVVHNDVNALNVLVDPAQPERITGVIDFGDLAETALIADVAVTAAEQIPDDCGADVAAARAAVADVTRGYHQQLPLHGEELALLGTLVAARIVTIQVVHSWHVQRNPGGGHYAPFDPAVMRARLKLAEGMLQEEITP